ncbi:two-component system sensor histidine kinase NtrB [Nitrospirillum amazonense]|uniref:two-component system sensor histidine kinase NtrB n=1 Tax=Nitrospirillum amazonense TaxID=28077 RepID=UPI0024127AD1|nr:ATP-binding protein [Nitrospirillum amazonense]MDG3439088.1 ATP-binding protein [Nitrospirillum amazonense]
MTYDLLITLANAAILCLLIGLWLKTHWRSQTFKRIYFDASPLPILIEDWSGVQSTLAILKAQGVTDVGAYLAANPELVLEYRKSHRFVDANEAVLRLFGASSKAQFMEIAPQLLPASLESNVRVYQTLMEGNLTAQGERVLHTLDGRVVPIIWRATLPPSGDASRILFYAFDVTDQKRAQEALMDARVDLAHAARVSTVGELSASIAHDVAQPLAAISASASAAERWLVREEPSVDRALNGLYQIRQNAQRANDVVGRIKTFLRKAPKRNTASIDALIRDALELIQSEAHRFNVKVCTALEPSLPPIRVDEVEVKQVVINLALNAMQAMVNAGTKDRLLTVTVTDKPHDRAVEVQVRDNGPGIAQDIIGRIFEPFFSTKADGMGLGLVICKSIVNSHGGDLTVVSVDNLGTVFRFTLPHDQEATPRQSPIGSGDVG